MFNIRRLPTRGRSAPLGRHFTAARYGCSQRCWRNCVVPTFVMISKRGASRSTHGDGHRWRGSICMFMNANDARITRWASATTALR